ncbi:unnamed protein product [Penicillium viridicatum]
MGGQLFFSERDEKAKHKRRLLREKNGFVPGAHKEEDSVRNKNKKLPKTKRLHQEKLGLWLEYVEKNAGQIVADFFLASRQIPKMDIRITKPLKGRFTEGKEPTVRSAQAWAEQFFGGFAEFTKTEVIPEDRTDVYQASPSLFLLRFGIGIRDSSKPQFAFGEVLLSLALEHGALFGIESVADLAQYDLSNGEIPLRWKKDYLSKPIFRNVTADGPQDIPLTQGRFTNYLHQIFVAAGYTKHPTIHCLRRNLEKEVEPHCSSMGTVSAILNEVPQSQHIEYFQGYGQFCEPSLPLELPAQIKESILMQPEMVEVQNRIENFEICNDEVSRRTEKLNLRESMVRKRRSELKQYQSQWVQWRRDQKILSRGKDKPVLLENDIFTRAQSLIMPEVGRIATAVALTTELSFKEKLPFVQDLQTQCSRDFDVVYLPNEEPIEGLCPSKHCQVNIERNVNEALTFINAYGARKRLIHKSQKHE